MIPMIAKSVLRPRVRMLIFALLVVGMIGMTAKSASAQARTQTKVMASACDESQNNCAKNFVPSRILTVHIGGFMDPHNESLIRSTLKKASTSGVDLYIIQLDSDGIAGANDNELTQLIKDAPFVTAIWIGPTSVAYSTELKSFAHSGDFLGAASKQLATKSGATIVAPSLREFVAQLDGKSAGHKGIVDTGCSRKDIRADKGTEKVCGSIKLTGKENFAITAQLMFEKLSPISNLGHAFISPGFAVGILVMGLCLLAFEYFAASVGVAAVAGILGAISGIYGLGYLPTHWWAVGLVGLGVLAMVIDVQAGGVGFYTALGIILLIVGSLFATQGENYRVSIASVAIIVIMALLFMVGAIPSLIRTRFGTPTIGREDFVGEEGTADGDIDPEGSVTLRGASWKARTNHSTPINDGEKCRVIKIEGIILEVEPLVGAAIDYREKRAKS